MGNFNNLPTEISLDIITRLPIESILDCKLVCKPWRNLVSHHPSFSQLHLTRLRDLHSGKFSFLLIRNQQTNYFEYNENNNQQTPARRINLDPQFPSGHKVIGSLNGLMYLYLYEGEVDTSCICNPMTREYVMLPKIKRDCGDWYTRWSSGFGYLPLTNEYKVVELYRLRSGLDFLEVVVYTLGSGNGWRNVGRLDATLSRIYGEDSVFVNGALRWMDRGVGEGRVFIFDLTEERFEYLSPPPLPLGMRREHNICTGSPIGGFGGVLYFINEYFCIVTRRFCFDVCLQAEHEPLGWRKEFSLPKRKPLAYTKSAGVLCFDYSCLSVYDAVASTLKKLVDFNVAGVSRMLPHMNTLVSMKELGEEDIKIVKLTRQKARDLTKRRVAK